MTSNPQPPEQPLASFADAALLLRLLGGWVATGMVPIRHDDRAAELLGSVFVATQGASVRAMAEHMDESMSLRASGRDPFAVASAYLRMRVEGEWDRARRLHRPRPRREAAIEGLENYRAALEAGHGAVLWRMAFGSSPAVNAALYQARVAMTHLSSPTHGLADPGSRLGRSIVVPLFARPEVWYLRERVVLSEEGDLGYLRRLMAVLADNGTVSIFGEYPGRGGVAAPILDAPTQFATGAPGLSYRRGSALIPVYAVRDQPGGWRVILDRPIEVPRNRGKRAYVEAAVAEYAKRLDLYIHRHPESWLGWWTRLREARSSEPGSGSR